MVPLLTIASFEWDGGVRRGWGPYEDQAAAARPANSRISGVWRCAFHACSVRPAQMKTCCWTAQLGWVAHCTSKAAERIQVKSEPLLEGL